MPKKSKGSAGKKSRSRGGKGKKKSKKGKKSKKKGDKVTSSQHKKIPESDVFLWVRRKNTSLFIEGTEDLTIKELKQEVATIYGYFPEDISLFNHADEMLEKKNLKKKADDKAKGNSKSSVKSGSSSGGRGGSKDKRGKKSKDKRRKSTGKRSSDKEKELDSPTVQIFTLGTYGFTARSSSLFNPGTIGLVFRDKEGNFEPLDITPWTKPIEIPDNVKPYLRNYNVEPTQDEIETEVKASTKRLAKPVKSTIKDKTKS